MTSSPTTEDMEKSPPQYESPAPTMQIPTVQAPRNVGNEAMLSATRIKSVALFFTAVLTAAVIVSGLIGAAVIFRTDDQGAVDCPTEPTASPTNPLDNDMAKDEELVRDNGEHLPQHITYDKDSNTVIIETPANISRNSSAATLVIDFDRSVVYISVHADNICLGYTLTEDMIERVKEYLAQAEENVVQLSTTPFNLDSYEVIGMLPPDYVSSSNGAVIQGLCSGRDTYWAVPSSEPASSVSELQQGREKRATTYTYYYTRLICSYCTCCTCYCTQYYGYFRVTCY